MVIGYMYMCIMKFIDVSLFINNYYVVVASVVTMIVEVIKQ